MNRKNYILIALVILISGCSSTHRSYYQTLKFAFFTKHDAAVELEQVRSSAADLMAVNLGERPQIIMALAFLENGQHKWVAQDNSLLVIENGRIARTKGLKKNLLYISNKELDPLKNFFTDSYQPAMEFKWKRVIDLSGDEYGYPIDSVIRYSEQQKLQILDQEIDALMFVEQLTYLAPSSKIGLKTKWKNLYWFAKNGELIKSRQQITPLSEPIVTTYLSRVARLSIETTE